MPVPTDVQERIREIESVASAEGATLVPDRVQRTPVEWSDPVRAGVSYFRVPDRRMPRGRITLAQNGQNATEKVMYRDYQLLRQYGSYHGANHPGDWQRNDVYLGIIHKGGLEEFDAYQIVENLWHTRPGRDASGSHQRIWERIDRLVRQGVEEHDAIVTVMPQLEGHDLTAYTCEACTDRVFPTAAALRQHRAVIHPDDVQTTGTRDAIAQALAGTSGGNADLAAALQALVAQNQALMEMLAAQNGAPRRGRPPKTPDDE